MRSPDPVLVVDDHSDGRDMLVEYLQFRGFNVHEAANGAAALALASTLRPRLILLDLAMRELDGFETTRRLRANPSTANPIIVAVTARVFATDRNEALRAGCDAFIAKPFDLTTLVDYIDRVLVTEPDHAGLHGSRLGQSQRGAPSRRAPLARVPDRSRPGS